MLAASELPNEESFYRTSFSPVQHFQPTENSYFRLATGMEAIVPYYDSGMSSESSPETVMPYLEITVHPTDRFRFRYKSESGSHGKLRGAGKRSKANFPTVKLHNYDSCEKIEIKVSLYTNEVNPRPHILELGGKNCSNGICSEILSEDNTAVFRYLEIESKKKDELISILSQNKRDLYGEENYDEDEIKKEALNEYKALNTNAARLCFEAFRGSIPVCEKVFSGPIVNLKAASSDLKIVRLGLVAGRCSGGEDMILLCNKVNKDDIKIRFYEKDENDGVVWEDYGVFNKADVHYQVAIGFKTPKYYQNAEKSVFIELYRPSDDQSGEALKFTYIPDEIDALRFSKKRKFVPTEYVLPLQDTVQTSSSSQFMTSPSNISSEAEDEDLFKGCPGSSNDFPCDPSLEEGFSIPNEFLQKLLQNNKELTLVDLDNFLLQLEDIETNESIKDEQASTFEGGDVLNPCEMDCATGWQAVFPDERDMGKPFTRVKELQPEVIATLTSAKSDHIFYKSIDFFSQIPHSLVSYLQNSLSSNNGREADVAHGVSASANNHIRKAQECVIEAQMFTPSDIDCKKSTVREYHTSAEEGIDTDNTNRNRKNLMDSSKKSENNKHFEQFKKGINDILGNRKKDAFVRYIANLMSVEDENGNLLLHLAVLEQSDNISLIAKILDIAPQNVNKQNKFKETCLHFATMKDSCKLLLYLMSRKGNPSIRNQDGDNCFHLAAKSNFVNCMKLLLLPSLKHGKRIPSLDDLNYDGLSPLHLSIVNNAKECMQLLLRAGANINLAERKTGSSPLHLAMDQHPSLVGPLLCHPGIDTDCTDFRGYTAYEAAMEGRGLIAAHQELLKVAQLSKNKEGPTIISFLRTESKKPSKLAVKTEAYESSSSETSSDSESEDVPNLPTTNSNHQKVVENIQHQNINCIQENLNTFDEEKICRILDANNGWRKLGIFIGFDESTLNNLKVLSKGSSPTKIILKKVKQLYGCDIETLRNVLQNAELDETAHMLENLNI